VQFLSYYRELIKVVGFKVIFRKSKIKPHGINDKEHYFLGLLLQIVVDVPIEQLFSYYEES